MYLCIVLYLTRNWFTAYTKDGTLSRSEEVHGSWLDWVTWVKDLILRYFVCMYMYDHIDYLLCHIEAVVYSSIIAEWDNH